MKKIVAIFIIPFFCIGCDKEPPAIINPLNIYAGEYTGQKIFATAYREYDSASHSNISRQKLDTTVCKLQVIPDGKKLNIKEYNQNNVLVKYWRGWEINNIGELAYFGTDTVGYGNISIDTLSAHGNFPSIVPQSDTLFYSFIYNVNR